MKQLVIIAILVAVLAILAFRRNRMLTAKAKQCSKGAKRFHEELQRLSDPARLFTDEELHQFKAKYSSLLDDVNELYDSRFISDDYLDKLGLADFLEERRLLNHTQYINNQSSR